MTTISTVIPCYNAEDYLGEAIESVLRQTRPVDEIIVVDDCSRDGSAAIAKRFGVTYVKTPRNSGEAAARNTGIAAAGGDFIAWLDADDYWDDSHLEVVAQLLKDFPEVAVAFSGVRYFGDKEGYWVPRLPERKPANAFWECFRGTIVPANSAITRRSTLLEVGGLDETVGLAPDFDLWLRLSRRYAFVSTQQITGNYRWHSSQLSKRPDKQLLSVYEARRRLLEAVKNEGDATLARLIEERMLSIWDEDLGIAWYKADMRRLRFLLSLSKLVPCPEVVQSRWSKRRFLPEWMVRIWGSFPKEVKLCVRRIMNECSSSS